MTTHNNTPLSSLQPSEIKALIGLGNPGPSYAYTPHNIGFLIVENLSSQFQGSWTEHHNMLLTNININDHQLLLIKPQTFMNNSGEILKYLNKRGIKQDNILIIHDEIDFPFGKITLKNCGSARGHNGLRSLIKYGGDKFLRLRVGVGRPEDANDVGNFVTTKFQQSSQEVNMLIDTSIAIIKKLFI